MTTPEAPPVVLGEADDRSVVQLPANARNQHTYVIGVNGTGKSTLLANMAIQDMEAGHGVCLIDPHGDLVNAVLDHVPSERVNDVLFLDPADIDHPFGLNPFECPDPTQRDLVCSEVIGIFFKLFKDSWGPRMEDLLRNATLTLLEHEGSTLDDLPLLLTNADYRRRFVGTAEHPRIENPIVLDFWVGDYDPLRPHQQLEVAASSLNKIRRFLLNPLIRNIVGQATTTVRFPELMNERRIVLVNLSKGILGEDNSALLGSIIIAKLLVAAFGRARVPPEDRTPFHLIVDEFQSFATTSFPTLLGEARKFKLSVTIAHQYLAQLDDVTRGATANAGNLVVFRCTGRDARELATEFDCTPPPGDARWETLPTQPYFPATTSVMATADEIDRVMSDLPEGSVAKDGAESWRIKRSGGRRTFGDVQQEWGNAIAQLPNHHAAYRLASDRKLQHGLMNAFPLDEPLAPRERIEEVRSAITEQTRRQVSQPRKAVEARLSNRRHWKFGEERYDD